MSENSAVSSGDEQPATLFDLPAAEPTPDAPAVELDDETQADDLAAEIDAAVPADAPGDVDYAAEEVAYTGVCRAGPYDGRTVTSRYASGFILYDKTRNLMWTYSADPSTPGEFKLMADGQDATADLEVLRSAAEDVQLDVLAFDDGPDVA